jgi:hypothetical protein
MYRWLRNTHLFFGLFCCLSLLVYGVSSVKMSHRSWFDTAPAVSETHIAVAPDAAADARSLARELMDRHDLRGEVAGGRATPAGFTFRIRRAGTNYEVNYNKQSGDAMIVTRKSNLMGTMVGIHESGGLWHESLLANLWGALVGIVSVGLIVLAASGIYLWFKIHNERLIGFILLCASLGYSLTVMILLRSAG